MALLSGIQAPRAVHGPLMGRITLIRGFLKPSLMRQQVSASMAMQTGCHPRLKPMSPGQGTYTARTSLAIRSLLMSMMTPRQALRRGL